MLADLSEWKIRETLSYVADKLDENNSDPHSLIKLVYEPDISKIGKEILNRKDANEIIDSFFTILDNKGFSQYIQKYPDLPMARELFDTIMEPNTSEITSSKVDLV